jgi:hypothetical protein
MIFRKEVFGHNMRGLIFSTTVSEMMIIFRINERDIIKIYIDLHVKCPLFLPDFNETWIFLNSFFLNPQISNFTKIRQAGADLYHAGRRTDMTKLKVAFRSFANAPNKQPTIRNYMDSKTRGMTRRKKADKHKPLFQQWPVPAVQAAEHCTYLQ